MQIMVGCRAPRSTIAHVRYVTLRYRMAPEACLEHHLKEPVGEGSWGRWHSTESVLADVCMISLAIKLPMSSVTSVTLCDVMSSCCMTSWPCHCRAVQCHVRQVAADKRLQQLDLLLSDPQVARKLMSARNNNGSTPLLVAARHIFNEGDAQVFLRILHAADATNLSSVSKMGRCTAHGLVQSLIKHIVELSLGLAEPPPVPSEPPAILIAVRLCHLQLTMVHSTTEMKVCSASR